MTRRRTGQFHNFHSVHCLAGVPRATGNRATEAFLIPSPQSQVSRQAPRVSVSPCEQPAVARCGCAAYASFRSVGLIVINWHRHRGRRDVSELPWSANYPQEQSRMLPTCTRRRLKVHGDMIRCHWQCPSEHWPCRFPHLIVRHVGC